MPRPRRSPSQVREAKSRAGKASAEARRARAGEDGYRAEMQVIGKAGAADRLARISPEGLRKHMSEMGKKSGRPTWQEALAKDKAREESWRGGS